MGAQLLEHLLHALDTQVHLLDRIQIHPALPHPAAHTHTASHPHARPHPLTAGHAAAHALHATAHGLLVRLHQLLPFFGRLAGHPVLMQLAHFRHVLLPLLLRGGFRLGPRTAGGDKQQHAAEKSRSVHLQAL
ncbi:hypothetical protein D3C78_1208600 [compost metagenome]